MKMLSKKLKGGFTLLELVFIIVIAGIIAAMSVSLFGGADNAKRFEDTRAKMEAIKRAIVGGEQLETGGNRASFGYHGDMGALPPSLQALTAPQAPAWTFIASLGMGAGWRGPYAAPVFPDPYAIMTDAWGNAFVYSTTAVTSFGADGAVGGSSYNSDLVATFDTGLRLSRVMGVVQDGSTPLSGQTAVLYYPSAGAITSSTATTDTNGFFTFNNIPFGPRAVQVTNAPGLGPIPIVVDGPQYLVPNSKMNFFGAVQKVTVNTATAGCVTDHMEHTISLTNSYLTLATLKYITVWWSNTARLLNTITLNSVANGVGSVASGTRITLATALTLPASANRDLALRWSYKMDQQDVNAALEWSHTTDQDNISWVTNTCANPSITTNNVQSAESNGNSASLNLTAYAVPTSIASPTLVVSAGGEDNSTDAIPTSATFNGTAMTKVTSLPNGSSGYRIGGGMFYLAVTQGDSGNVVVTFPGNTRGKTIIAYTLNSTKGAPEAVATAVNASGAITASITTASEYAMVATAGADQSGNPFLAAGTNHNMDATIANNKASGAGGHVSVDTPMTISGIGWSNTGGSSGMVTILASFAYTP